MWQPTPELLEGSHWTRFTEQINQRYGYVVDGVAASDRSSLIAATDWLADRWMGLWGDRARIETPQDLWQWSVDNLETFWDEVRVRERRLIVAED